MMPCSMRMLALGFSLALGVFSPPALAAEQTKAEANIKLVLPDRGYRHAGFYMALEKGYFKEAGINLELEESPNPISTLVKGGADFAVAGVEALVYRAGGVPVVSVAAVFQHAPVAVFARAEKVPDIASLSGKVVYQDKEHPFFLAFLKSRQITPVLRDDDAPIRRFLEGEADGVLVSSADQWVRVQNAGVPVAVLSPRQADIDAYGDILLTRSDFLDKDKKSVLAFRRAALQGWKYALANVNETVDLIEKKYPSERPRSQALQEVAVVARMVAADWVEIGHQDEARWAQAEKLFIDAGILKSPADIKGFIFDPRGRELPQRMRDALLIGLPAMFVILMLTWRLRRVSGALAVSEEEGARALKALKDQALWDAVSELHNQRYFEPNLERELARARRKKDTVALVMVDIDLLKRVNERWGDAAGDTAVKCVAKAITGMARDEDVACRLENAELVVLMPRVQPERARELAEGLRERIESTPLRAKNDEEFFITVSVGVSAWPQLAGTPKALVDSARSALFAAKTAGRNRVAVFRLER